MTHDALDKKDQLYHFDNLAVNKRFFFQNSDSFNRHIFWVIYSWENRISNIYSDIYSIKRLETAVQHCAHVWSSANMWVIKHLATANGDQR